MKRILVMCAAVLMSLAAFSQEVIKLYPGKAPGSENWTMKEFEEKGTIYNVTDPTLTVYRPAQPNGIGVIVCPGGGYQILCMESEGTNIAKKLAERGFTAFVLKYRIAQNGKQTLKDCLMDIWFKKSSARLDSIYHSVEPLMTQDGMEAVKYVRAHAKDYGIDQHKIGITGFSAGGTETMLVTVNGSGDSAPDFAMPVYAYMATDKLKVPEKKIPVLILHATDDSTVDVSCSLAIFNAWHKAGQKVEMHLFQEGNHGFVGSDKPNTATQEWLDLMTNWMNFNFGGK